MTLLLRTLRRMLRREEGTSTIEFVIIVPILFGFVINSSEAGLVMLRSAFLDWGLNNAVRELRLGTLADKDGVVDSAKFVSTVCENVWILGDEAACKRRLQLEVVAFDRADPAGAMSSDLCVPGSDDPLPPPARFTPGSPNSGEITIVRICASVPALTPSFGIGAAMKKTADGDYFVTAMSAYTSEPS